MAEVIQVQRPDIGRDNDPEWPTIAYGGNPPRRKTDGGRIALPWQALALLLAFLLLVGAFGYWRYETYCSSYSNPCWWHAPALTTTLVLSSVAGLLGWLYTRIQVWQAQADAERNEARTLPFVKNRYGDPEPVHVFENQDALQLIVSRYLAATQLEQAIAPYKIYSGVETLNEGAKTEIKTDLAAPPQLPVPATETPGLAAERDWLDWIDRTPHLIIAGRTDAGKTTHASAILAERAMAGEQIAVFDPHYQPGKWLGLPAIGGGRNFEAILCGLMDVLAEMNERFKAFERGAPTEAFDRLTVLVDEVPAIYDMCIKLTGSRRTVVDDRWPQFARRLGSEARKVRISVILLTQSHLVQDIGVNVAMRENFTRLALGDKARDLLVEEPTKATREELIALLRDRPFPAAMEYRNRYYVLENGGVPALAGRAVGGMAQPWVPQGAPQAASAPELDDVAADVLTAHQGNRVNAARALLAVRGTRVRGGWAYEVREVARALSLRDEVMSRIGRPS